VALIDADLPEPAAPRQRGARLVAREPAALQLPVARGGSSRDEGVEEPAPDAPPAGVAVEIDRVLADARECAALAGPDDARQTTTRPSSSATRTGSRSAPSQAVTSSGVTASASNVAARSAMPWLWMSVIAPASVGTPGRISTAVTAELTRSTQVPGT
jgi:hypothetical protein